MVYPGSICYASEKNKIATDLGYFGHLDLIKQEYLNGKTILQVGKISGVTHKTVLKLLDNMGVNRRSRVGTLCYAVEKNKIATDLGYLGHFDLVKQEYIKGKSMSEVAKIAGITTGTVWKLLKKMDVPRRSRGGYNYKGKKYHETKSS